MPAKGDISPVQSHTEYVRTRARCPGCGNRIPAEAGRADSQLCVDCKGSST
jgi:hypothetical protein